LNRFFALLVAALPLALVFLVIAHLDALHEVDRTIPDGVDIKKHKDAPDNYLDGIPSIRTTRWDLVGVAVSADLLGVIFFAPTFGGLFLEGPTSSRPIRCRPTAAHCAVWYFHADSTRCCARLPSFAARRSGRGWVMGARSSCCSSCRAGPLSGVVDPLRGPL